MPKVAIAFGLALLCPLDHASGTRCVFRGVEIHPNVR